MVLDHESTGAGTNENTRMQVMSLVVAFLLLISGCQQNVKTSQRPHLIVSRKIPSLDKDAYNVAFLIMDGVYNTELTAPFDVFQHTKFRDSIKPMNVFLVANTYQPITTFEGLRLLPDFNYVSDSLPKIDILVVPSAEHHLDSDLEDKVMIDFIKKVDREALYMTSHCDGAFVLAQAGLLDRVASTTFPSDIELYQRKFPQLDVHSDVVLVHDGKYITSVGGAKSFEAALYLVEVIYGSEIAESIARGLVIDWDRDAFRSLIL